MKYFLALLLSCLLLTTCHQSQQPGATLFTAAEDQPMLALKSEFVHAVTITSPFQFDPETKGRLLVHIGNPHSKEVQVKNADSQHRLAAKSWRAIIVEDSSEALEWASGELKLGSIYRLPVGKVSAPNILVLSIDTLRYDAFTPELMPGLYGLLNGSNGANFSKAYATSPWTLPSHASLFAGQYPSEHGVRLPSQKLDTSAKTLAEVLRDNGYLTTAVTEGNYLDPQFGLAQGFHRYVSNGPNMMSSDPDAVSKLAPNIEHLERHLQEYEGTGAPHFAFFHTYEVHCYQFIACYYLCWWRRSL